MQSAAFRHVGTDFYPRSPCGERRSTGTMATSAATFLSTLSLRRATMPVDRALFHQPHFYPRSPCGERRKIKQTCRTKISISIHALLAESDPLDQRQVFLLNQFLSTLSLRRATISARRGASESIDFYPRSPCGERPPEIGFVSFGQTISIHALLAESDCSTASPRIVAA